MKLYIGPLLSFSKGVQNWTGREQTSGARYSGVPQNVLVLAP